MKKESFSFVVSDCWRAYDCLDDSDFQHLRVCLSIHFLDPATVNTQNILRLWWELKESIPHYGRKKLWRLVSALRLYKEAQAAHRVPQLTFFSHCEFVQREGQVRWCMLKIRDRNHYEFNFKIKKKSLLW